jgi:adenylylsulfate kinase
MQSQVVWFTGLSGAGKTTLCQSVAKELSRRSHRVQVLDGDDMREHLCADLSFSTADRIENVRRISYVAELLAKHDVIVLVALISPLRSMREVARKTATHFCEVFVDAPVSVCEGRDVKGLYKGAREGKVADFTGISSLYEPPLAPEVICHTTVENVLECTAKVLDTVLAQRSTVPTPEPEERQRRPSLAVDFDGVIADYDGWRGHGVIGKPRADVVHALRLLAAEGWKIIVHTTRSAEEIAAYLQVFAIPFEEINRNSDYRNAGAKPVATVYWDDRALRYSGSAMEDLELIRNFRTWSGRR